MLVCEERTQAVEVDRFGRLGGERKRVDVEGRLGQVAAEAVELRTQKVQVAVVRYGAVAPFGTPR
jgi:hypothetical protein